MKNRYYIMFRDKRIYVKKSGGDEILKYEVEGPEYPNVPFYSNIFDDGRTFKEFRTMVKNNFKLGIIKPEAFVIMPDDVIGFEKRALDEFVMQSLPASKVILGWEYAFAGPPSEPKYVCISRTCRMMVLSYIKNKEGKDPNDFSVQKFIEDRDYSTDELMGMVRSLHDEIDFSSPPIYLNGKGMEKYTDIGKVLDVETLFKNMETALDNMKI